MIVCMGDSITFGQYLSEGQKAWPELIGARNLGVSNDTTRLMLERFPQVQTSGAKVCVIQAGHNDCNRWATDNGLTRVSESAFVANLREMIDRCWVFKITPLVCTITPTLKEGRYEDDAADFDNALRVAVKQRGVQLIDVRTAFQEGDLKELLLYDRIHLSEQGHKLYAETVKGAL